MGNESERRAELWSGVVEWCGVVWSRVGLVELWSGIEELGFLVGLS